MIYKVNFRMTETSDLNNVYVGADSEQDARDYVCNILIPAIGGDAPYYVWVETICRSKKKS